METKDGLNYLRDKYAGYDFFDSVGLDQFNRYVVYVKYMDERVYKCVEDQLDGKQVLLWFANSKPEVVKYKYATTKTLSELRPAYVAPTPVVVPIPLPQAPEESEEPLDLDSLDQELDRLERQVGTKALADLFFEVHDGPNAVTNQAAHYPDAFRKLEGLYAEYGFDLIYESLEM